MVEYLYRLQEVMWGHPYIRKIYIILLVPAILFNVRYSPQFDGMCTMCCTVPYTTYIRTVYVRVQCKANKHTNTVYWYCTCTVIFSTNRALYCTMPLKTLARSLTYPFKSYNWMVHLVCCINPNFNNCFFKTSTEIKYRVNQNGVYTIVIIWNKDNFSVN